MQKTLQNIADVSLFFFLLMGLLHIAASALVAQNVISPMSILIFRALDLPFLLAGLIYGTSRLSISLGNITGNWKTPVVVCSLLACMVFFTALYLNFFLPDVPSL
jgi:hypothetical protein